jgi:hypothetical protein
MTCPQCGAAIKRGDGRFCSHCAAALPDRPRIAPEEWSTHVERFEEAERHPQHAFAMGAPAPKPALVTTVVVPAVFLVFWLGIGSFVTSGFAQHGGAMVLFPLGMLVVGVVVVGKSIVRALAKASAPVERRLAVVVDERTDISTHGSGDDRRTSTTYYTTLQFKDGARLELPTSGSITGTVTRGDIGLAVMRGGDLVDFHRFASGVTR